jgi:DNA-binding transcriptional ArsR family regulator
MIDHANPLRWTLLTNHGAVLLFVALYPEATIREIAEGIGITERATARILSQLRDDGYVVATRRGRRNSYAIGAGLHLRHAVFHELRVDQLLIGLLTGVAIPATRSPVPHAPLLTAEDPTADSKHNATTKSAGRVPQR